MDLNVEKQYSVSRGVRVGALATVMAYLAFYLTQIAFSYSSNWVVAIGFNSDSVSRFPVSLVFSVILGLVVFLALLDFSSRVTQGKKNNFLLWLVGVALAVGFFGYFLSKTVYASAVGEFVSVQLFGFTVEYYVAMLLSLLTGLFVFLFLLESFNLIEKKAK